jgi:hypothetical protein
VGLLLQYGADPRARDAKGNVPRLPGASATSPNRWTR